MQLFQNKYLKRLRLYYNLLVNEKKIQTFNTKNTRNTNIKLSVKIPNYFQ